MKFKEGLAVSHRGFLSNVTVCNFKISDYILAAMRPWNVRKVCAFVLVLLVGMGFAAHGVAAGQMAAAMMAAAGADDPMPGSCDACGDVPSMTADCSAMFCVGPKVAAPPETVIALISGETVSIGGDETLASLASRPDPYPPKS